MERPKVGVSVIIKRDGKVLIGKRKASHGTGTWAFPGGHLEYGESWEDCAKREVAEEVGIAIRNVQFAAVTNDIFQKEEKHYITIFVTCDYESGEVKVMEPEKCEEWLWMSWEKLPGPLFLPIENLLLQEFKPF